MSNKGGTRKGAGRPPGRRNKQTVRQAARLSELAREYTEEALKALADVMMNGSDAARVSAANAILDRGYGKALQPHDLDLDDKGTGITVVIQKMVSD